MNLVQIFDPPLCCSSGVCGPAIDPELPRFAADLDWLKSQGVRVERYNLAQQPGVFAENEAVRQALATHGNECLPLVLVDGRIASRASYPAREELADFAGLDSPPKSMYSPAVAELVAIGAAIAANCEPCFKYHYDKAKKLGVSAEDMARAVETADAVKRMPGQSILRLADRCLGTNTAGSPAEAAGEGCCGATTGLFPVMAAKSKCC